MEKDHKRISYIIAVFALIFVVSVVYAATTGALVFEGVSHFSENVDVIIYNPSITSNRAGETVSVSADGHTMNFSTTVSNPGDLRYVTFSLRNIGNQPAELDTLITSGAIAGSGVEVTWPNLNDIVIQPGATSGPHTIVVEWDTLVPNAEESVQYSATIDFDQFVTQTP